ncbi:hypothetical protein S3E15_02996 [Bacillus mycoides]|uniref:Uncharacterized protein n=1 Tax=Bacillus mycoides TaxID=1405 RepID=A0AAP7W4E3_BACMY|nr:hypothetical protein M2E15_2344 [Bacillus mycoides]OSX89781.1 hypothetical protein S3E15_02996 [Bacillus mycoides]OSX90761.1 hypothetical protein BTJ44_01238 [Bacillus mycoides]OSY02548.1 hypothetical protein S2E19_03928 [Bacillus mycoides]OSY07373.1 hypothetical protein BTJ48_03234 [Bacillus mycoides]
MERRGIYEKIIPIVALIGMMSLGIQEMVLVQILRKDIKRRKVS